MLRIPHHGFALVAIPYTSLLAPHLRATPIVCYFKHSEVRMRYRALEWDHACNPGGLATPSTNLYLPRLEMKILKFAGPLKFPRNLLRNTVNRCTLHHLALTDILKLRILRLGMFRSDLCSRIEPPTSHKNSMGVYGLPPFSRLVPGPQFPISFVFPHLSRFPD